MQGYTNELGIPHESDAEQSNNSPLGFRRTVGEPYSILFDVCRLIYGCSYFGRMKWWLAAWAPHEDQPGHHYINM